MEFLYTILPMNIQLIHLYLKENLPGSSRSKKILQRNKKQA